MPAEEIKINKVEKELLNSVEDPLFNPFVIQCPCCLRILADSFSLINVDDGILFFQEKSEDVVINTGDIKEDKLDLSHLVKNPFILPSSYHILLCTCSIPIGIFLHSAPRKYNGCSGTFCFLENKVKIYQLNSSTVTYRTLKDLSDDVEKLKEIITNTHKLI